MLRWRSAHSNSRTSSAINCVVHVLLLLFIFICFIYSFLFSVVTLAYLSYLRRYLIRISYPVASRLIYLNYLSKQP